MAAEGDRMEYRSQADDAWYEVRLLRQCGALRVMLQEFREEMDEWYEPEKLINDPAKLGAFLPRFRRSSRQLDDCECRAVPTGTLVCAACNVHDGTLAYYDAVLIAVAPEVHENDKCKCKFRIRWKHGPLFGRLSETKIASLCLVSSESLQDPILTEFVDSVKKLMAENVPQHVQAKPIVAENVAKSPKALEPSLMGWKDPEPEPGRCQRTDGKKWRCRRNAIPNEKYCELHMHRGCKISLQTSDPRSFDEMADVEVPEEAPMEATNDLNSQSYEKRATVSCYIIWIQNLEKDLLPTTITEFIFKQTTLSTQVTLFPVSSADYSAKEGYIYVGKKQQAQNLLDFLLNPEHIIVSSKGRPWVTELLFREVKGLKLIIELQPTLDKEGMSTLKLVERGSEEFERAKKVLDLHREYYQHVQGLRRALLALENKQLME